MRIGQLVLTLLTLFLGTVSVRALHNVTYNSNDTALLYQPTGSWRESPSAGCLPWPSGQSTTVHGTITLYFEGVSVFVYGFFNDSTNPIYTIKVDEDVPIRPGAASPSNSQRCEPLFSKTRMAYSKHRVIFNLTNERPSDVKDLSFQGIIVTVPDSGDGTVFNTTVPYSNLTSTAPGQATNTSSASNTIPSSDSDAHTIKTSTIVVIVIVIVVALCLVCFCGGRRVGLACTPLCACTCACV
ncbi:hypothetical protein FRC14_006302 [Serendipita sp. 396]|nr:hypothetical protein FRC14_006302 [Serendipita sp. 396]KAG8847401.1 hypothetical protein FRB91_011814 [Serendipita sp. 411]